MNVKPTYKPPNWLLYFFLYFIKNIPGTIIFYNNSTFEGKKRVVLVEILGKETTSDRG